MNPSPREYRIAPELWRSCWYLIAGAAVLAAAAYWVTESLGRDRGPAGVFAWAPFALVAVAMVVPLRWRLRVDSRWRLRAAGWRWAGLRARSMPGRKARWLARFPEPWGRKQARSRRSPA